MRKHFVLFFGFVFMLFVFIRLRELLAFTSSGFLASRQVDPMSLTIKELQLLLDQRDIRYGEVPKKQELSELVASTGGVSEGELKIAAQDWPTHTEFISENDFNKQTKDPTGTVWVVQVAHGSHTYLPEQQWKDFIHKISKFGIHTGYVDCSAEVDFTADSPRRLCAAGSRFTPRLILVQRHGRMYYSGTPQIRDVFDWIHSHVTSNVRKIQNIDELNKNWLDFENYSHPEKLRVIIMCWTKAPPLFYSIRSVKFNGRYRFGYIDAGTKVGRHLMNMTKVTKQLAIVVLMPEKIHNFGSYPGEYTNFNSLAFFLKTLYPDANDILVMCLVMFNLMRLFEIFLARGNLSRRFWSLLCDTFIWNVGLILLWSVVDDPSMAWFVRCAYKLQRVISTTNLASMVRADWQVYHSDNILFICVIFILYGILVGYLHHKYYDPGHEIIQENYQSDLRRVIQTEHETNTPIPASVVRRQPPAEDRFRDFMDFMDFHMRIQRNETSMLIEQSRRENVDPRPSTDYIENLPRWKHAEFNPNQNIPPGMLRLSNCTICQEDFVNGVDICGLPCGHSFHNECVVKWLKQNNHLCPLCRKPSNALVSLGQNDHGE